MEAWGEVFRLLIGEHFGNGVVQGCLVGPEAQHIVRVLVPDDLGDLPLAPPPQGPDPQSKYKRPTSVVAAWLEWP